MSGDRTPAADAADAADAAERADVVHEDRPFLGPPTRPHNEVQVKFDWIFFLNGLLGVLLALADDSFVLAIHGEIASEFHELSMGPWLVSAYNMGYTASLPMYGRLCDVYGYKIPLLGAYAMFTVGCTITGTAVSIWIAVVGRLIAGMGGSGMADLLSVLVSDMVPLKEVAVLRSYIGLAVTLGISSGAPLGGILTDTIGWRWSFLCQVPLALLCIFVALWRFPSRTKDPVDQGAAADSRKPALDILGICLLAIAIGVFIVLTRSIGDTSLWKSPINIILLVVELLSLGLFIVNETFWTKDPLIPLSLIKTNGIGIAYLMQILLCMSFFGVISNITEFFARTENISNAVAGAYQLPVSFGNAVGALACGPLIKRTGRYKLLSILCLVLASLSYLLIAIRWPQGPRRWELLYTFGSGMGIGGLFATLFMGLSASIPKGMSATAITVYYMAQQLGMILGVTLAAAACRRAFEAQLFRHLGAYPEAFQSIRQILDDYRFVLSFPESVQSLVQSSFLNSFINVPALSLGTAILALPLLLAVPERSLD